EIRGADIVIIVAGMGGGTGTGSAAVISGIAKDAGILNIVMCSKPFSFEGAIRAKRANEGIEEFKKSADSYIIISNEDLLAMKNTGNITNTFAIADDILLKLQHLFINILFCSGNVTNIINTDLADIKNGIKDQGQMFIGRGNSKMQEKFTLSNDSEFNINLDDKNACEKATLKALYHPLIRRKDLASAKHLIVYISATENIEFAEITNSINTIKENINNKDVNVIFGAGVRTNTKNDDEVEVLIIATGINNEKIKTAHKSINEHEIQNESINTIKTEPTEQKNVERYNEEQNDIPAFFRRKSFMMNNNDFNKIKK
ncbi:MAG: hypothetical protein AAFO15_02790, partial [Pseudomonadota bacterium]